MYKKDRDKEQFKNAIESTVKAIAEKKNLSIFFGELDKTKKQDIVLPSINNILEIDFF